MSIMNVASTVVNNSPFVKPSPYCTKLNVKTSFSSILKILTYSVLLKKQCIHQIPAADCHQEPAAAADCEERRLCCDDRDTACHNSQHSYVSVIIAAAAAADVTYIECAFLSLNFIFGLLSGCSGMVFFNIFLLITYMNNFSD